MGLFKTLAANVGKSLTAEDLSKTTGYNVSLIGTYQDSLLKRFPCGLWTNVF